MRVNLIGECIIPALQVFNLKLFYLLLFYSVFGGQVDNMSGGSTDDASDKELKKQITSKAISFITGKKRDRNIQQVSKSCNNKIHIESFFEKRCL